MGWPKTKARMRRPSGLCALALFVVFLHLEFTREAGASSSFLLWYALANLVLTFWASAAEQERERHGEQRRDGA